MKTLDDLNTEILEIIRLVPEPSSGGEELGTIADIESAYGFATGKGVALPIGGKMIAVFNVACPSGWTRVSAWDDKFIRGATTYGGTGGSSGTHTHEYSGIIEHTHGAGTLVTAAAGTHTHSYSRLSGSANGTTTSPSAFVILVNTQNNTTGSGGSHSHSISGSTTSTGDASLDSATATMLPSYIEVVFCSRD